MCALSFKFLKKSLPVRYSFGVLIMFFLNLSKTGSLGFTAIFDSELHLPQLPTDVQSKNKLVLHGSGNTSPNPETADKPNQADRKPNYNSATRISRAEFAKMYNNARKSKDWTEMEQFYAAVFQNPSTICATFKKELAQNGARLENPDLKDELLNNVLEKIEQVNGTVQKAMLKSIGK